MLSSEIGAFSPIPFHPGPSPLKSDSCWGWGWGLNEILLTKAPGMVPGTEGTPSVVAGGTQL